MNQMEMIEEAAITHHPTPALSPFPALTNEEKIATIADAFRKILEALELDPADPSLSETPRRVAKMYVEELFSGLDPKRFPEIRYLENEFIEPSEGMILVENISVKSICEHHFVPFIGKATVAYLPRRKILGLSKINRIVDYFCRRPQLQERLTVQIADSLSILLDTPDVAVAIKAEHFCVSMRGIRDESSLTETHVCRGQFQHVNYLRDRFFCKSYTQIT
jgi:GTP cyclohydrolase IA